MKKVRGSTFCKLLAIFLLIAMGLTFTASTLAALLLYQFDAYSEYNVSRAVESIGYSDTHGTAYAIDDALERMILGDEDFDMALLDVPVDQDFCYVLYDEEQNVLFDGLQGADTIWSMDYVMHYVRDENDGSLYWNSWFTSSAFPMQTVPDLPLESAAGAEIAARPTQMPQNKRVAISRSDDWADTIPAEAVAEPEEPQEAEPQTTEPQEWTFVIRGCILSNMTYGSRAHQAASLYSQGYNMRYQFIGIAAASLLLAVILFIFLMCAAGHRGGTDTVTPNFSDKAPFDLFAAVLGAGFALSAGLGVEAFIQVSFSSGDGILFLLLGGVLFVVAAILLIWFCMSLATRLKLGTVIKSCVCFKLFCWCWRAVRAILRWCWRVLRGMTQMLLKFLRSISLLKKTILILAALLFVELFWMAAFSYDADMRLFGWFVERSVLVLLVLYGILCMRRLQKGAREIAMGNENYVVDTRYMRGDLREHAENLNSIRDGMTMAVNERMKSERFKTELITNVSHDIKTPLTSIVNYVDLLSKEKPENEKMQEYIEVLSRQSARLKKLIDDLIEASKASTGNLSVNYERCELGVLLDQTVGEYAEKIAAAGLELVIKKPEEPVTVVADGRHTWRIFDNLMNNICKYAQPGTRVYLNLEKTGNKATVTFRNISRSQLNISGDELMERFVRGDSSRNTEGSGLGLSIARSLAQLQRSDLELTVDGDLFKVTLSFDTAV